MDTEGNIRELQKGEKPALNEIPIKYLPDPKCKDCYGRGFIRLKLENIVETRPCHCVMRRRKKRAQ